MYTHIYKKYIILSRDFQSERTKLEEAVELPLERRHSLAEHLEAIHAALYTLQPPPETFDLSHYNTSM